MLGGRKADIRIGGDFSTVPADKYTVQIADVNFKTRFNKWKNEEEELLNFQYVILDEKPLSDDAEEGQTTRGKYLWHAMSQSLSSRSWLMKLAKALYGRDLTKEELDPASPKFFDPEKIIGQQVDVMVTEDPNKDNTAVFNNVVSYSKSVKKLEDWFDDRRAEKLVVETKSQPATQPVETPDLNPELSKFLDEAEEDEYEDTADEATVEDEDVAALEAKLKAVKAKAKKDKEVKKNKPADFPLN